MAQALRYIVLVLVFILLGWKVYKFVAPEKEVEAAPTELHVGDPESEITRFYGQPMGVSERSGVKRFLFESAEIEVTDGVVTHIADQKKVTGTLQHGGREVIVDGQSQIDER